ncbi:MAG: orotidine-5'-phosphate decarboxylase [Deltaproteobacteria bacterium HGW-Deltaproteobacteria-18]|jgi:orotidine-5'-phosphate decarboxylase|nr:MAG: orotidine-5'-phosphate decarboxylase [Deltaproteobacteria bacterium HGW-Deltaproteobacteria-18]
MKTYPALVVALDFPETAQALALASSLQGVVPWVKVGLELYLNSGQELVARLKDMGFKVFLDLKFMDIPNTVQAATAQATRMGVDMLTIHALGGRAMCEAAAAGRAQGLAPGQASPLILAVTLLTSLGSKDLAWNPDATEADLRDLTVYLAQSAQNWKLDGVVCSGREVRDIRQACGASFQLLTPGIRLPDADCGDQSRVCTPAQAARDGSDYLVVGRPITRSDNPVQAARNYLKTIT